MECVNCKKPGHTFRDCKEATRSYGVIAIRSGDDGDPQYLLIRRRDSLGYVDFMRGKYTLDNPSYIQTLLNQMSTEELARLQTVPFDALWTRLWNSQNTRQFRNEFEGAKRMFDTIRNTGDIHGRLLSKYIEGVTTTWSEPEWGFPKGRRSLHEAEMTCAIREFSEETGLTGGAVHLIEVDKPEVEEYVGSNGIVYRHVYYMAKCNSAVTLDAENRVQTREVGDIGWFPFDVAYRLIRNTNPEKRAVLGRVHARIMGL